MEDSVSPLYSLMFNAFFIVFIVAFYIIGVWQWKMSVTDDRARRAGPFYYALLVLTFSAACLARIIEQLTGLKWADALVPIFGGLFALTMVYPLIFLPSRQPLPLRKRVLSWIKATLIALFAILLFFVGFKELLSIIP